MMLHELTRQSRRRRVKREPNDTALWATLRATIGAFMETQFRNGAFAGTTTKEAFFVKELSAPNHIVCQHFLKFGFRGDLYHPLVELVCGTKPFGIPGSNFSKHTAAMLLPEHFYHQIQMAAHHPHTLLKARFGQQFAGL